MKVTHFNWRYISLALLTFCLPSALATTPHFATSPNSGSSYLIDANGTLLSWGNNSSGILGIGSSITQPTPTGSPFPTGVQRWKVIAAGFSSALCSIAIADNGGLYGAGGINVAPYGFLDHPNY